MKDIKCLKCGKNMRNMGNLSGIVLTSYPVQWDDTYACDGCETRQTVRERGQLPPDNSHVLRYEEQGNITLTQSS